MRLLVITAAALLAAAPLFAAPREINFDKLPDPAAMAFNDPFREMGLSDLGDLRTVVRLEARLRIETFEAETRDRLAAQVREARKSLENKGYDIDALLASRWEVATNRKRARVATNSEYEGAEVALDGFLIPAGNDTDGASVGYLVSSVGLCSHKPAPEPNKLVRVRYGGSFPSQNLYVPVSVVGTLLRKPGDETIFLLDGTARMLSMWQLSADQIVAKGPVHGTGADQGARSEIDPISVAQGAD
ncbi:DUF3299 domain-containing protein [Shimia sp. W99]